MWGKVKTEFDYGEFARHCNEIEKTEDRGFNSFKQLLSFFIQHKGLIVCDSYLGEVMWADEVRFNYKTGEIYLPYVKSEYKEVAEPYKSLQFKYKRNAVAYHHKVSKYVIYGEGEYKQETLYGLVEIDGEVYGVGVSLKGLPLCVEEEMSIEARDLFKKYISQAYGYRVGEEESRPFYRLSKSAISKTEYDLLKILGLEYYDKYENEQEVEVSRAYHLEDLLKVYTADELQVERDYVEKRFEFESELFCGLESGYKWHGWTKSDNSKLNFLKYKEKGISLIVRI